MMLETLEAISLSTGALWACAPLQASFGTSSRFLAHIKAKKARRLQNSALAKYTEEEILDIVCLQVG
jgi:hypothetical protein